MINLDGRHGEGGGQIIRTAVALSGVTSIPVHIFNIRANRPKPGLSAQHLKAVEAMKLLTDARVEGASLGSVEVKFYPQDISGGRLKIDIGTAGSITLLLQCVMPLAIKLPEHLELEITGGTDVAWSPPIDFLRYVLLPALRNVGYKAQVELLRRGYYPEGGGLVKMHIEPSSLSGISLTEADITGRKKHGTSHCSKLPEHVARRQAGAARKMLVDYETDIRSEKADYFSTGSGITLWNGFKSGSALGRKGLPAEKVGQNAAEHLLAELSSDAAVDVYMGDQLLPYMALARQSEICVREISEHMRTNMWVIQQFLDVNFDVEQRENVYVIRCD